MTIEIFGREELNSEFNSIVDKKPVVGSMAEKVVKLSRICRRIGEESEGTFACMNLQCIFSDFDIECTGRISFDSDQLLAYRDGTFAHQWFFDWKIITPLRILKNDRWDRAKTSRFVADPQGWDVSGKVREQLMGAKPQISQEVRRALEQ